jgi:hypothetical protein
VEPPELADLVNVDREVLALMLVENAEMVADELRRSQGRGGGAVLASLGGTHRLRILLEDIVRSLVVEARGAGCTWAAIGEVLHVTRQAAFQRFGGEDEETAMDLPAAAMPRAGERATALLVQFFAGEWAEMRSGFNERMAEACPAELLDSVRSRLDAELGRLVRMRKPTVGVHGGHTVVDVPLVFDRGIRTGRVAFDPEGRVSGFFVLLPQAAP